MLISCQIAENSSAIEVEYAYYVLAVDFVESLYIVVEATLLLISSFLSKLMGESIP